MHYTIFRRSQNRGKVLAAATPAQIGAQMPKSAVFDHIFK
jgi:hypothetical protein